MTAKRTGGRILVDNLVAQGCDRIFHVPGESFLAVLDALHDTPEVDVVTCRQEGGVSFMACADGTMTGRPGVAFVTRGPGATNASIGVHVAMQDSQPMILFIGDVDRGMRDREGFQEVDFPAMFAPLAKWATRIEDAARIPEYVARAWNVATSGRPGPVVIALPEDMLCDEVEAMDRPPLPRVTQAPDRHAMQAMAALIKQADRPIAIVGGAGWTAAAGTAFASFAERIGLPVVSAFRRQDALPAGSQVYAGNLGYGPNPKLVSRIKGADLILAVGARLGEATTDGYALITPDHPGQTLIHVHPDPNELGRVYRADVAICSDMTSFAGAAAQENIPPIRGGAAAEAHAEWLDWSTPKPREGVALDLGQCVLAMRAAMPADTIICNGAGNFSSWWHRYWRYGPQPSQLAPTAGAMGYGVPAAVARQAARAGAAGGRARRRRRFHDERAGTRHRRPAQGRHPRAGDRQRGLWHDPHAPGARISGAALGHRLAQPRFRRAGPGLWLLGRNDRADGGIRPRAGARAGRKRRPTAPPEDRRRIHHAGDDNQRNPRPLTRSAASIMGARRLK